jgi:hypothetical protein
MMMHNLISENHVCCYRMYAVNVNQTYRVFIIQYSSANKRHEEVYLLS